MPKFKLQCVQVVSRAVWVEIEADRASEAALLIQTQPYRVVEVIKEHVDAIVSTGEAVALMRALKGTEEAKRPAVANFAGGAQEIDLRVRVLVSPVEPAWDDVEQRAFERRDAIRAAHESVWNALNDTAESGFAHRFAGTVRVCILAVEET